MLSNRSWKMNSKSSCEIPSKKKSQASCGGMCCQLCQLLQELQFAVPSFFVRWFLRRVAFATHSSDVLPMRVVVFQLGKSSPVKNKLSITWTTCAQPLKQPKQSWMKNMCHQSVQFSFDPSISQSTYKRIHNFQNDAVLGGTTLDETGSTRPRRLRRSLTKLPLIKNASEARSKVSANASVEPWLAWPVDEQYVLTIYIYIYGRYIYILHIFVYLRMYIYTVDIYIYYIYLYICVCIYIYIYGRYIYIYYIYLYICVCIYIYTVDIYIYILHIFVYLRMYIYIYTVDIYIYIYITYICIFAYVYIYIYIR